MRILVALSLLACAAPALAQEQEGKLLDRLLRPDMKMQNAAQNKHFTAGGNQVDKQAVTPTFHYQEKSNTRTFASSREIGATNFTTDRACAYQKLSRRSIWHSVSRITRLTMACRHAKPPWENKGSREGDRESGGRMVVIAMRQRLERLKGVSLES